MSNAKPLNSNQRGLYYLMQTDRLDTPAQRRRKKHKHGRLAALERRLGTSVITKQGGPKMSHQARKPVICAGCGEEVEPGQVVHVLVQAANHAISVPAHENHRESAHANTMERTDWKRNDSFSTK